MKNFFDASQYRNDALDNHADVAGGHRTTRNPARKDGVGWPAIIWAARSSNTSPPSRDTPGTAATIADRSSIKPYDCCRRLLVNHAKVS
jgi:hypothetical protein